jgi:hypothetical protein
MYSTVCELAWRFQRVYISFEKKISSATPELNNFYPASSIGKLFKLSYDNRPSQIIGELI